MNSLTFPIPVSALQEFLPHRPPMVWVNQVNFADATTGVCSIELNPESLDFGARGPRQSSLIEWMAQSFGFAQATQITQGSNKAYLAALRDVEYCDSKTWDEFVSDIQKGDKVTVTTKVLKTLAPITLLSAEVKSDTGVLLAKASLKIYIER